jgi:hypothetical protein
MRKKVSTTVYLTEEQNSALKVLNKKTRIPIAEFIREGIDLVLHKYKEKLPGQMTFEDIFTVDDESK